jgi:hypothetical protein
LTYKTIIPSTDWFFVQKELPSGPNVMRVAAWALTEEGEVIGLLGPIAPWQKDPHARLVPPPPVEGTYLHLSQLTDKERESAAKP